MPTEAVRINVFLSSPGNLKDDRDLVKRIVSEINIDTGSRSGYFINLITWETHSFPAAGPYPQGVINNQIPEDIDIFVGMMGHYFGTKTKEWNSGTEEEFRIAHEKHKGNGYPKIMFYFSEFVKSTREINAHQLSLVENFKSELGDLGFLYGTYNELSEFGFVFRRHLTNCIADILESDESKASEVEEHSFAAEIESDYPFYDSLVLSDPIVSAHVHLDNATQDLNSLSSFMERQKKQANFFAKELTKATQKMEASRTKMNPEKLSEALSIITSASSIYTSGLQNFIAEFRRSYESLIGNLQRYQILIHEAEISNLRDRLYFIIQHFRPFLESLRTLKISATSVISAFDEWPEEVEIIQVTKKIIQALVKDLEVLFDKSINLGETFCVEIEGM